MEENLKSEVIESNKNVSQENLEPEKQKNEDSVNLEMHNIVEFSLYLIGVILLVMCVVKYGADLETYRGEFRFSEESYVGGDAYNYIISAARSTAVMVKSLILAVLGCSSIIVGILIRIATKK